MEERTRCSAASICLMSIWTLTLTGGPLTFGLVSLSYLEALVKNPKNSAWVLLSPSGIAGEGVTMINLGSNLQTKILILIFCR